MIAALQAESIERIAVFRALVLGDMLCATPALRALRAAWSQAELTLIGLPWAADWAARLDSVDRFVPFYGFPGLPERTPDVDALPGFIAAQRARPADLMVQLHGSGGIVNPLLACLGARRHAGFADPGTFCSDPPLHTPWPRAGHEFDRLLHLTDALALPRVGRHLDFPIRDTDRAALDRDLPELARGGPIACVHPGAQLPSRRWPLERFAAVADALAERGLQIVLTGTAGERELVAQVQRHMRHRALDLAGRTTLWTLGALLERAQLLVCNDTGVQHVAAALGTASVAVSCGADVARWAPLDSARHRVLWADAPCRPCAHRDCPTQHECAREVSADAVAAAAVSMLVESEAL